VPLHLTKVAFGHDNLASLEQRARERAEAGEGLLLTTRYLPKRHAEIVGGSLFWIIKHQLVARSPILEFGDAEGGRIAIHLASRLILVEPRRKRAHQGWRYLEHDDVPADLGSGAEGVGTMPAALVGKLSELALI
jgi:hypothetical protein